MRLIKKEITVRIFHSSDIYRIWDVRHAIPRPQVVRSPEIYLGAKWERIYWNTSWGRSYDRERREGAWLKQKVSLPGRMTTGYQCCYVRYWIEEAPMVNTV